jgi:putative heme-binding domain-containing protein
MFGAVARVFGLLLVVLGGFLWVGDAITVMTGGERKSTGGKVEISPEGGETIFWGRGRCFTCHSVGNRGSAVRGPNQGQFGEKFPQPIGERAELRAKERSEKTGETYSRTDYLIESLAKPGAYVVKGYKNEMAVVYAPPISLGLDEIKAVITYLQSQGGDVDLEALNNPGEISKKYFALIAAASAAGGGDPGLGAEVFKDNCNECHRLKGEGGGVGPDLSAIGGKGLKFIADSILRPTKELTKGFETYVAVNKEGRKFTGLKTADTATEIEITKANGEAVKISKSELREIKLDDTRSVMPDDLTEALTVKDYQDLLSFMIMQKKK